MWTMRALSSGGILKSSSTQYFVTKDTAEIVRRSQIDPPPTDQLGQFRFDAGKRNQPRRLPRRKFHQQVHIAVRSRCSLQDRSEQRETLDVMPLAERDERGAISKELRRHSHWLNSKALIIT